MARARQRLAVAAVAPTTWATTATPLVTWIVASWMPAASPRIAWKSAWSAAASASPHREACVRVDWVSLWGIRRPWSKTSKETAGAVTLNSATSRETCMCESVCYNVLLNVHFCVLTFQYV